MRSASPPNPNPSYCVRDIGKLERDANEQARATRTVALDEVTVRFVGREGRLTVRDATLRTADNGVAGRALRDALNTMDLDTMDLDRREVGRDHQRPDDFSRDERLPAPRIIMRKVRGAQIGDYNVQINRFVARNEDLSLDLDRVLRRDDVRTAIQRLQRDPSDDGCRKDLERALADDGWHFFSKRQVLEARSDGQPNFLRGLVTFESWGLQIGDHGEQRNTFYYTVRSPDAADLLRDDRGAARALAVYLCPRGNSEGDFTVLRGVLEEAIGRLPVRWDRDRLLQFRAPRAGETLRVDRADAVSIGEFREVRSTEEVSVRVTNRGARHIPSTPGLQPPTAHDIKKMSQIERRRAAKRAEDELTRWNRPDRHTDRGPDTGFTRGMG